MLRNVDEYRCVSCKKIMTPKVEAVLEDIPCVVWFCTCGYEIMMGEESDRVQTIVKERIDSREKSKENPSLESTTEPTPCGTTEFPKPSSSQS